MDNIPTGLPPLLRCGKCKRSAGGALEMNLRNMSGVDKQKDPF